MTDSYTQQYLFIGLLACAGLFFGIAPLILAKFVAPKKPGLTKQAPYECGLESVGDPWVQFKAQYYVYALLFVIFDVEVLFIYPWALIWKEFGAVALVEMGVFIGILGVALAYAWKKGVLEWE